MQKYLRQKQQDQIQISKVMALYKILIHLSMATTTLTYDSGTLNKQLCLLL